MESGIEMQESNAMSSDFLVNTNNHLKPKFVLQTKIHCFGSGRTRAIRTIRQSAPSPNVLFSSSIASVYNNTELGWFRSEHVQGLDVAKQAKFFRYDLCISTGIFLHAHLTQCIDSMAQCSRTAAGYLFCTHDSRAGGSDTPVLTGLPFSVQSWIIIAGVLSPFQRKNCLPVCSHRDPTRAGLYTTMLFSSSAPPTRASLRL